MAAELPYGPTGSSTHRLHTLHEAQHLVQTARTHTRMLNLMPLSTGHSLLIVLASKCPQDPYGSRGFGDGDAQNPCEFIRSGDDDAQNPQRAPETN